MSEVNVLEFNWNQVLEIIPTPIIVLKKDLSFFYANQAAQDLWTKLSAHSNILDNDLILFLKNIISNTAQNDVKSVFKVCIHNSHLNIKVSYNGEMTIMIFELQKKDVGEYVLIKEFFHNFNNPIFIASGKLQQIKNKLERDELSKIDLTREIDICLKNIGRANESIKVLKSNL